MQQRVLVFAPHPDDDVLGCGGSIAKHVQAGNMVKVVYLTSGGAGSLEQSSPALAARREAEAKAAALVLGVSETIFCRYPDGYLSYDNDTIEQSVALIRQHQPHMVYVSHAQEEPRDHRQAFAIVREACRRAKGPWFLQCGATPWAVDALLTYEVLTPLQTVNYTEDITDFFDQKRRAVRAHSSQTALLPYEEAVQGLNRYRGIMTGKGAYCECFQLLELQTSLITNF
ncbi:MAG: PIG-L family deacetylase [Firmicutes bacterium]|nr:PIG-L family deacetylase [Bacillota bacterium]